MRIEGKNGWVETSKKPRTEEVDNGGPDYNSSYILFGLDYDDGYWPDIQFQFMDMDENQRTCVGIEFSSIGSDAFNLVSKVFEVIDKTQGVDEPYDCELVVFDFLRDIIK